jgi:hypothetical protein
MFVPRFTLVLLLGFALFVLLAMLYSLPVIFQTPPPNAGPDFIEERVRAHLEGKVSWIMLAAFGIAVGLASRWLKR